MRAPSPTNDSPVAARILFYYQRPPARLVVRPSSLQPFLPPLPISPPVQTVDMASVFDSNGSAKGDLKVDPKMEYETGAAAPRMSTEDNADHFLESLGYKPELSRNRSTAQVAFMSFVLASIPYGLATTLLYPLVGGGSVVVIWGWVLVSAIIVCVASSLGEITSVYPTAGGKWPQTHTRGFEILETFKTSLANPSQVSTTRLSCLPPPDGAALPVGFVAGST